MRGSVVSRPRKAETKWILCGLRNRLVQLLLQVRQQRSLRRSQSGRVTRQRHRTIEFEMREPTHVVKVQCIGSVVGPSDVGVRPCRRLLQVVGSWMKIYGTTGPTSLYCKIEFGRAQFHVIAPFRFGIKTKRRSGQQIAAWRSVSEIQNVLGGGEALVGICCVASLIHVVAESEISSQSASNIRTDECAGLYLPGRIHGGRISKDGAMADVTVQTTATVKTIVSLWQAPDIVIADGLSVPVSDRHLVVKDLVRVVPHVL